MVEFAVSSPQERARVPQPAFAALDLGTNNCRMLVGAPTGEGFRVAFSAAADTFTWHRFAAIQIWLFTCFLIYVTAIEVSKAVGPEKLKQLFFGPR